jgi:hypothetical protein
MEVRDLSNSDLSKRIHKALAEERALKKTNIILDGYKDGLKLSKEELFKTIMFNKIVKQ